MIKTGKDICLINITIYDIKHEGKKLANMNFAQ